MVPPVVKTAQETRNETPMPSTVFLWLEADAILQPSSLIQATQCKYN